MTKDVNKFVWSTMEHLLRGEDDDQAASVTIETWYDRGINKFASCILDSYLDASSGEWVHLPISAQGDTPAEAQAKVMEQYLMADDYEDPYLDNDESQEFFFEDVDKTKTERLSCFRSRYASCG